MRSTEEINKLFGHYAELKTSENSIEGGYVADTFLVTSDIKGEVVEGDGMTIITENLVERLSPHRIDSNLFWKKAVDTFAITPISRIQLNTPEEINLNSWRNIHSRFWNSPFLKAKYKGKNIPKILEIGPGYGCVKNFIDNQKNYQIIVSGKPSKKENLKIENYYCIDVNPLFEYERMFKTDGQTIPEEIPKDLDVVYSVNVFQHLHEEQRHDYYKQILPRLKKDGIFVMSLFVVNEENEKIKFHGGGKLFGWQDDKGNYYSNFFSQFIRIPWDHELLKEVYDHGFKIEEFNYIATNHALLVLKKR